MVIFTEQQWRVFNRIRRKHKVSIEFLKFNKPNIIKFIAYYARRLHFVLKRSAERGRENRTVIVKYNRIMRSLFDEAYRKRIKRRRRNIKQWSRRMVQHLRKTKGVKEYISIKKLKTSPESFVHNEEVTKQLKEQLELLRSGKRSTQLIDCPVSDAEMGSGSTLYAVTENCFEKSKKERDENTARQTDGSNKRILNEKTGILESNDSSSESEFQNSTNKLLFTSNDTSDSQKHEHLKGSTNILDLLMSKVRATNMPPSIITSSIENTSETDAETDSCEEFLGFAEDENVPGLMGTPVVPSFERSKEENGAFVSESLDEYFRQNALDTNADVGNLLLVQSDRQLNQVNIDGLMMLNCKPPKFDMPAVPESLQKLRTVAERRLFLQKFSKNFKLAIISNEAAIYRDLQRKIRQPKNKITSQQAMQSKTSQMAFTRQGWLAASFVSTEINKFFYQKLYVKEEKSFFELRGVRGNNAHQYKPSYSNKVSTLQSAYKCTANCIDCHLSKSFRTISEKIPKTKLCKEPYRPIFKPCPLSRKPHQTLQDEDAAAILLSGGGMTVVRLPTVELEVCPDLGKPLNEVAKRYLQHILPYQTITREWAEFSTSTLKLSSEDIKISESDPKSFAFTVPFVNDKSHLLVRRIVDRSERMDPYFLCSSSQPRWSGLTFCEKLDKTDKIQMECASVLADMINSVAISCCENSFIKDDIKVKNNSEDSNQFKPRRKRGRKKVAIPQKTTTAPKKSRLICELRRLNATIIETNAKHNNDNRKCPNEFCSLGCVCPSLIDGHPMQQHCGKAKCMLQCTCKVPSQIIRIETDGRSITTEDAYNMRRQATARLARIEKDFTSTVVVTENETLLINETEYDKKRRCTKVPKRYLDYQDTNNEVSRISSVKLYSTAPSDATEINFPSTKISEIISDLQEPLYVKDVILKQIKHCSIPVVPYKDIQNMAIWCMIHQMYKCFCGGRALEGKPLQIEKEDLAKVLSGEKEDVTKMNFSSKAYYSFENFEESTEDISLSSSKTLKDRDTCNPITSVYVKKSTVKSDLDKPSVLLEQASAPTSHINNFLKNYFKDMEHLGCCRVIPVPSRSYKSLNRKRREDVLADIEYAEDDKSQLLLNEHIMRSVYYHKEELEEEKELLESKEPNSGYQAKETLSSNFMKLEEEKLIEKNDSESSKYSANSKNKPLKRNIFQSYQLPVSGVKKAKNDETSIKIEYADTNAKILPFKNIDVENIEDHHKMQFSNSSNPINMTTLKISGCYTLKSQTEYPKLISSQLVVPTSTDSASYLSSFSEGVRENYNEIIRMLNNLVSRKMHDIDNALKRDSKIVPPPTENVLCVLQWINFLGAFHDGLLYIWEVKMKTRSFLAATVTNMIPTILGALAVISISETPFDRLPLIGRMLRRGSDTNDTKSLAVIMQGRLHYWLIKGFLKPNVANACLRPTPQTHPELTKKINTLCSSLIKQRTRELERRDALIKPKEREINNPPLPISPHDSINRDDSLNKKSTQNQHSPKTSPDKPTEPEEVHAKIDQKINLKLTNRWSSNILLKKLDMFDSSNINIPQINKCDETWYVLDLCNDFSHIFVPVQREIVSLDRIQRLAALSDQKQKVIRIEFLKRSFFDAFIVPNSKSKIYFGPFPINSEPPLLVLLQSVDGKMMTRETYQWLHKIPTKSKQTKAFWLRQMNGKTVFDDSAHIIKTECSANEINESTAEESDSEADCIIVENKNNTPNSESQSPTKTTDQIRSSASLTQVDIKNVPDSPCVIDYSDALGTLSNTNASDEHKTFMSPQSKDSLQNASQKIEATTKNCKIQHQEVDLHQTLKTFQRIKNTNSHSITLVDPKSLGTKSTNVKAQINTIVTQHKESLNSSAENVAAESIDLNNPKVKIFSIQNTKKNKEINKNRPTTNSNSSVILANDEPIAVSNSTICPTNKFLDKTSSPVHTFTIQNISGITASDSKISSNKIPPMQHINAKTSHLAMPRSTAASQNPSKIKKILPTNASVENVTSSSTAATSKNSTPLQHPANGSLTIKPFPRKRSAFKSLPSGVIKVPKKFQDSNASCTMQNPSTSSANQYKSHSKPADLNVKGLGSDIASNNHKFQSPQKGFHRSSHLIIPNIATTEELSVTSCNAKQRMRLPIFSSGANAREKNKLTKNYTVEMKKKEASTVKLTGKSAEDENSNNCKISLAAANYGSTTISSNTTSSPNSIYGYLCSNIPGIPRFLSKCSQSEIIIKVPVHGLVKVNGIAKANAFLNHHIAELYSCETSNMSWRFEPQKKVIKRNDPQNKVPFLSKPILEKEKVITSTNVSPITMLTSRQKLEKKTLYHRSEQDGPNITGVQPKQTIEETILIDD